MFDTPTTSEPCAARPLAWRWLQANSIIAEGGRLAGAEDDLVRSAVRFLQALDRCQDDADRARVHDQYPALTAARALYDAFDSFNRWHLEARLLAGEDVVQIAAKCGLTLEVIRCYHDLFFDVQERLEARDFLYHTVIGPKAREGLSETDREVLLKLFALSGGPRAVDALVDYFHSPPPAAPQLDGLDEAALHNLQKKLRIQQAIQSRVLAASEVKADQVLWLTNLLASSNNDPAWPGLGVKVREGLPGISSSASQPGIHRHSSLPMDLGALRGCQPEGGAPSQQPAA
jgi:hypothetical protein